MPISIGVVCVHQSLGEGKARSRKKGGKVSDGERGRPVCVHRKKKEMRVSEAFRCCVARTYFVRLLCMLVRAAFRSVK